MKRVTTFRRRSVLYPVAQALLLSALVVVFALAAKVSWYHPQQRSSENIVAAKACKATVTSTEVAVAPAATALLPWVLCLVALLLGPTLLAPREPHEPILASSAHQFLWAARPPPVI